MSKTRYSREVSERIRLAKLFGYELIRMKKHLVFQHPNGARVTSSRSSTDGSIKEFISDMKRGIKFKKVS